MSLFSLSTEQNKKYWHSRHYPIGVAFEDSQWEVVACDDADGYLFYSLYDFSDGSAFILYGEIVKREANDDEIVDVYVRERLFNGNSGVRFSKYFIDRVNFVDFRFRQYEYENENDGHQLVCFGHRRYNCFLLIVGLKWPKMLEIPTDSFWPIKHKSLLSEIRLSFPLLS